jgi:hypothetical protein
MEKYKIQFVSPWSEPLLEFTSADADILHASAPLLSSLVPNVVDAVYLKLFDYDITKIVFLPRDKQMDEFTVENEIIKIRKDFLTKWFVRVVSADYTDPKTCEHLNRVGWMQSVIKGKPAMVGYMCCGLLLGWVVNMLMPALLSLEEEKKGKLLVALVWIQNDLFAKHYMKDGTIQESLC